MDKSLPSFTSTKNNIFTSIANGTVESPSISFVGDESTGMYLSEFGNLAITASGTRCLNVTDLLTTIIVPLQMEDVLNMNGNVITNCNSVNVGNTTINTNSINATGSLTLSSTTNQVLVESNPTAMLGIASKQYVDSMVSGLSIIAPVTVVTDTELVNYIPEGEGIGKTLTAPGLGVLIVDGITTSLNDRILVNNIGSLTASDRGIYYVSTEGTDAVSTVLTRASDFDESADILPGAYVSVLSGTDYYYSGWVLIGTGPYTVDTTPQEWTRFTNNDNVAKKIILGLGTIGAPSLTFNNSSTTGLYSSTANNIEIVTAGIEAAVFSPTGMVFKLGDIDDNKSSQIQNIDGISLYDINSIGDIITTGNLNIKDGKILEFGEDGATISRDLSVFSRLLIDTGSGGTDIILKLAGNVNELVNAVRVYNKSGVSVFSVDHTGNVVISGSVTAFGSVTAVGGITTISNMTILDDNKLIFGNGTDFTVSHISATGDTTFDNITGRSVFKLGSTSSFNVINSNGVDVLKADDDNQVIVSAMEVKTNHNILLHGTASTASTTSNYSISLSSDTQAGNENNRYWTYFRSTTDGDKITINKNGIYSICGLHTSFNSGETAIYGWITKNLDPTLDLVLNKGSVLKFDSWGSSAPFEIVESTYIGYLTAGSVLRIHIQAGSAGTLGKINVRDSTEWRIEMNFIH
jgi:hypothetical protein